MCTNVTSYTYDCGGSVCLTSDLLFLFANGREGFVDIMLAVQERSVDEAPI